MWIKKMHYVLVTIVFVLCFLTGILLFQVFSLKHETKPRKDASEMTSEEMAVTEDIQIYLPDVYYAAAGLTMEIYNSQITNKCSYITAYNVVWTCDVGENLERKYSLSATDEMIGDHELTVSVYDSALKLLAEKSCTLKIVEGQLKNGFSLLQIGDSLSCDGILYRRLQGLADNQIVFNGTIGIEGFLTEAHYGFSADDYLKATSYALGGEECHKFFNPTTEIFDWNYYRETNEIYPDVIQIFLGTNNIQAGEANADDIVAMIDAIRKDDVLTPIYVVNTIYQGSQDGLGSWKNKNGEYFAKGWNKHEQDVAVFNLMVMLEEKLGSYEEVYLVPAGISMDSEYNYERMEVPVNPYSNGIETIEKDPVHPNKAGYYQIADVIFSVFCGTRNEQ